MEANAVFAGVTLEASFARLRASIATFSEERAPSCPFGRWDIVAMVGTQGSHEEAERGARRDGESERQWIRASIPSSRVSCELTHLVVQRSGFAVAAFQDACDQLITSRFSIPLPLV